MIKNNIIFCAVLAAAAVCFPSCNGWLEATSDTQIQADKMFSTKSGFYDAVTGVYISLANCYGSLYTYSLNDRAAFPFQYVTTDAGYYIQLHDYTRTGIRDYFDSAWSNGYNVIANINIILRELENRKDVIPTEEEYNLIKGELLALRAYLHFDIMRMFGVNDWSGENASKMAVPYVTSIGTEPEPQRSYSETAKLLLADIDAALECLYNDPVTGRQSESFYNDINQEGFWNNRTKHMNYYAAEGLAARVYQWMGDTETAASYAQDVIDNALGKNVVSWVDCDAILSQADFDNRDWTFSTEHLFSLEVTTLGENAQNEVYYTMDQRFSVSQQLISDVLFVPVDPVTGSVSGAEDIRGTALLMRYSSMGYRCYKLYYSTLYAEAFRNRMPMIKIPEMYYIVAENHIANGRNDEALAAMDEVRSHRAVSESYPSGTDAESELMKEYYREFMLEGQLFYWLKHKNVQSSLDTNFDVSADDLVYPYPDDEINYGRVQEL